ncbi:MAG: hypothetical protein ABDI19_02510 [Armatimonadota bacterium]
MHSASHRRERRRYECTLRRIGGNADTTKRTLRRIGEDADATKRTLCSVGVSPTKS